MVFCKTNALGITASPTGFHDAGEKGAKKILDRDG